MSPSIEEDTMARKTKTYTMLVTVRVPAYCAEDEGVHNAAAARREVRSLIQNGAGWYTTPGLGGRHSITCKGVRGLPRR
jgi:hypothetical protein